MKVVNETVNTLPATSYDVAEYRYNGLHWRIAKDADTSDPIDGTLDERRLYVYDASWRVLQEEVDADVLTSVGTDRRTQQSWGIRSIDEPAVGTGGSSARAGLSGRWHQPVRHGDHHSPSPVERRGAGSRAS